MSARARVTDAVEIEGGNGANRARASITPAVTIVRQIPLVTAEGYSPPRSTSTRATLALVSQRRLAMATATGLERRRSLDIRSILLATSLTVLFLLLAGLIGAAFQVATIALLLAAVAFAAAGVVTMRLRPTANPLDPGLGAAAATILITVVPLLFTSESTRELTSGQIATSVLVFALFGFTVAWTGARITSHRADRGETAHPRQDAPSSV